MAHDILIVDDEADIRMLIAGVLKDEGYATREAANSTEVLQELHNRGGLEIMRGALAASDEILETVVDDVKTPKAIRAIRNLLFWRQILGSIEPEWFKGIFKAIPEGIAEATAEVKKPVGVFTLLRRLTSKDSLRGLAAALDFLQAFGRHLQSAENPLPRD